MAAVLLGAPTVKTEAGLVSGVADGEITVYKGIPYAAAPAGEYRWRAPRPPVQWEGVRSGERFGPPCVQDVPERVRQSVRMSEDCLSLNIWAPAKSSAAPLPVMVWIHGGGFRNGTGSYSVVNGAAMARSGVVVVTMNYRLADFGLFAHPALSAEKHGEPLANFHLLDQVAALRWLRDNIAAFGGDPKCITVFGESAGGNSVLHLMTAQQTSGLFQRAVMQSGGAFEASRTLSQLEADGRRVGDGLGIAASTDAAAALRAIPAEELLQRFAKARAGKADYSPVIDGRLIVDTPGVVFKAGKQHAVPLLVGANSYEGSLASPLGITAAKILALLGPRVGEARKIYGAEAGEEEQRLAEAVYGDMFFVAPARFLAAAMEHVEQRAWLYHFSYVPEKIRGNVPGAPHGLDVPFVFANKHPSLPIGDVDMAVGAKISGYWVRFAKTGDPNGAGNPPWPAYRAATDELIEFGDNGFERRKDFRKAQLDLCDSLFRGGMRFPSPDGW